MRVRRVIVAVMLLAWASPCVSAVPESGLIDLRGYDFHAMGPVELKTSWFFVWQKFLAPGDGETQNPQQAGNRAFVLNPGQSWDTLEIDGARLGIDGWGTYVLHLLLPETTGDLGLALRGVTSSAKVFWNGTEVGALGKPADRAENYEPVFHSAVLELPPGAKEAWLVMHVANFDDVKPGLELAPILGEYKNLVAGESRGVAFDFALVGVVAILGLYHIFLWIFRRSDASPLWFAAICYSLALRILVSDAAHLSVLFEAGRWSIVLNYLSFPLLVFLIVRFITKLFPLPENPPIVIVTLVVSLVYSACICFWPPSVFTRFAIYFQIFTVVAGLVMIAVLVHAIVERSRGAILFLSAFMLLFGTTVYDILKANFLFPTPSLAPYGILAFVLLQSLILTRASAFSIHRAELVSRHIQNINRAMGRFVPQEVLKTLGKSNLIAARAGDHVELSLTVLYADVRSFAQISRTFDADRSFAMLNNFYGVIETLLTKHGGFLQKIMGDGFIALFPGSTRDALEAAIAIQKFLEGNRFSDPDSDLARLHLGIGIHYGNAQLGIVGSEHYMESSLISEAVNLAARLQGLTRALGGKILLSEGSVSHIANPENFHLRRVGSFPVYAISGELPVVECIDAESPSRWELLRKTKRDFERAVYLWQSRQFPRSTEAFEAIRSVDPDDPAVHYYLNKLRERG